MATIHFADIDVFPNTFRRGIQAYQQAEKKWEELHALGCDNLNAEYNDKSVSWTCCTDGQETLERCLQHALASHWQDEVAFVSHNAIEDNTLKKWEGEYPEIYLNTRYLY